MTEPSSFGVVKMGWAFEQMDGLLFQQMRERLPTQSSELPLTLSRVGQYKPSPHGNLTPHFKAVRVRP